MSATGLKCPECGREAKSEQKLFRRQKRWRWVGAGALLLLASYPVFKWPLYQKSGPIGFVPRVVTLAFFPEIMEAMDRWFPKRQRPLFLLLDDLYKARPFDVSERYALAWMCDRVLKDPQRAAKIGGTLSFSVGRVGDQAGVLADGLAVALGDPRTREMALSWIQVLPLSDHARFKSLTNPLTEALLASGKGSHWSDALLERMLAWGATREELRTAAFHFIDHPMQQYADGRAMEFVFREGLARSEDFDRLVRYSQIRAWPFAEYASYCLAELGVPRDPALWGLKRELANDDLQSLPDRMCLALAFGERARSLLPELDRYARATRYPSFRACGTIAGVAIRGRPQDAYELWHDAIAVSDNLSPETKPQRYKLTPLVMFLNIPDEDKAVGLSIVVHLEKESMTPNSVSGNLLFAVNCIGKLKAGGRPAAESLIDLIEPDAPGFVVERVLESLGKIGPLDAALMKEVNRRMAAWNPGPNGRLGAEFWWRRFKSLAK